MYLISSLECSFKSEREEPFYLITAEIKNKTTLEDSLQLFIESEHLTGENKYQVDASGDEPARKVEATRRCIFRDLPEVLIVHLKRFDFDLETLSMKKLNDFFAFPCDLVSIITKLCISILKFLHFAMNIFEIGYVPLLRRSCSRKEERRSRR